MRSPQPGQCEKGLFGSMKVCLPPISSVSWSSFMTGKDPSYHGVYGFTDITAKYKLPFCELYAQGYRSLGARYNTRPVDDIPAWEQDIDNIPERLGRGQNKEKIMEQLRNLGYM